MAVALTVSRNSSGVDISDFLIEDEKGINHGSVNTNYNTLEEVLYIRHDGVNPITGLAIYVENASELLGWADADNSKGLQIDIDNDGNYDTSFRTGVGDSVGTAISLGDLNPGQEKVVRLKIEVPSSVSTPGTRKFNTRFTYEYTS